MISTQGMMMADVLKAIHILYDVVGEIDNISSQRVIHSNELEYVQNENRIAPSTMGQII